MAILLEQEISNHPIVKDIKRKVVVYGTNIDGRFEQIVLDAEVHYFDENDNDVTAAFVSKLKDWIINNQKYTTVRNRRGQMEKNPFYKEAPAEGEDNRTQEEKEQWLKMPSFDYFLQIIKSPSAPNLIALLKSHIIFDDEEKSFDKMLNLPI